MDKPQAVDPLGKPHMGLLDSLIFGLMGTPDQLLPPQQMQERQGKRAEAGGMARQASLSPGDEFMWAPNVGGGQGGGQGFGLSDIIKLFAGGGAGAGG